MAQGQEVVEGCASQIWRVMAAWVGGGDHNRRTHSRKIEMSIKFDEKMCDCCLKLDGWVMVPRPGN